MEVFSESNRIQGNVMRVELTIPVKRIETMPEKPMPSASMYLVQMAITNINLQMKRKTKRISNRLTRSMGRAQTSNSPDYEG